MPGVKTEPWEPVHVDVSKETWSHVADTIIAYLETLPLDTATVSIRKLKADCGLKKCSNRVFQRAREVVRDDGRWDLVRRSLQRRDFGGDD